MTRFREVMRGEVRLRGDDPPRVLPMSLALTVDAPGVILPWSDVDADAYGRLVVPGWCDQAVRGTLRIAPLAARRIHYRFPVTLPDGRAGVLEGWKSVTASRPLWSMTRLPLTLIDDAHRIIGEARLRFDLLHDLGALLIGVRYSRTARPEPAVGGVEVRRD